MEENNNINLNNKEEKNNKNKILIVIVVILLILLLGLTYYTFFVRDTSKVDDINKSNPVDKSEEVDNIQKENDLITIIRPSYSITDDYMGEIVIAKTGDVYWFDADIKDNAIGEKLGEKGTYKIDGYAYPMQEKYEGYKLKVTNIKSAYFFHVSNSGYVQNLVLISSDNKASILVLSANYTDKVIEDAEYKMNVKDNIITAMKEFVSNSHSYCLIDKNGKSYSYSEFISRNG